MKLSQGALLKLLSRKECPFCECAKLEGCMFCDACFTKLPEGIKHKIKNGLITLSEGIRSGINFLEG